MVYDWTELTFNKFIILEKCWSEGNITDDGFTEKMGVNTVEECQYQCMNDTACSYFQFTKHTNSCKAYGESAVVKYKLHDLIVFGQKKSKRKFHYIRKQLFIYNGGCYFLRFGIEIS